MCTTRKSDESPTIKALHKRIELLERLLLCQQCDVPGSGQQNRARGIITCTSCEGTGLNSDIVNPSA